MIRIYLTTTVPILLLFTLLTTKSYTQSGSILLKDGAEQLISTHGSVAEAYGAIPGTLTQAYFIEITSAYTGASETYPITFIAKSGASANNTITLRPEAGVSSVSIAGTVSGNSLLRLDDADYIIVDGRAGGTGFTRALTFNNLGTSTSSSGIHLINGACNNIVRYCNINGYSNASSGGRGIYIQTSTSNPTGNSNNSFEFLHIDGPRYYINSVGTSGNPNRNLRVFGCEFVNIRFSGWWQQAGTGKITIDSSFFYCTVPTGTSSTGMFAILSDFQTDTIIATRNHIYNMDNGTYTTTVFGMCFRSFNPGSYIEIYNNFISMTAANPNCNTVTGIEFGTNSAANPVQAHIYYNSIRLGGTAVAGTVSNVNSAPFSLDATNAGSVMNIMNNIFVNERTGGNEQHLATVRFTNNGTINSDYNTYFSATADFARVGTTVYPDLSSFQAIIFPADTMSNMDTIQFISATDLHLTGNSIGNPNLAGIQIPGITTDIDGNTRFVPYRGADEFAGCQGAPTAGSISGSATHSCQGDTITLVSSGHSSGPGIVYQWQMAPAGTGNFYNIPGANDTIYTDVVVFSTDFRLIDSCENSSLIAVSDTFTITFTPDPTVFSISQSNVGSTYTFTAQGVQNVTTYFWDFGDGNTSNATSPSHTYANPGNYTVILVVGNDCGSDSASLQLTIQPMGTTEENPVEWSLYPNPAQDWIIMELQGNITAEKLAVINAAGITIREETPENHSQPYRISTETLPAGLYIVQVYTSGGILRKPFLVQH